MASHKKDLITACAWCKHVMDESGMPLPEVIADPVQFEAHTGIAVSHSKCKVCTDRDTELQELRAARLASRKLARSLGKEPQS